ncbi:uncharacterized protein [Anoplolepis gracilipes]|uniref:uncharacterized protein isoform X2 n=1 Tax=Anoplolepis gracilipes TaxID=354296 RepID=UPI003BA2833B
MLLQRLHWLLPALIVSLNLQLSVPLPVHDERSHVTVNTFDPSVTTSTMIRQEYKKRVHPLNGKNGTQSSHKLVASPAGLLRPDKFQFYTYNDKGDMITRQMTAQEIQGLIAAGGTDHVAIDRQEPQKADDVLTGGKKVMDVVQKVQNVLKSALDKPPILTGSIPKIPEHANVEWSNILPSILSGETDAISPSSESNHLLPKITTEKIETSSTVSTMNIGTSLKNPTTKKPAMSDIQTNAYAGFTNNMQHNEKLQLNHYSQQTSAADIVTEKPMIPVPVITLTEQKLSTLHSAITESPIFQMLSVIPAESTHKTSQTDSYPADIGAVSFTQPSTQSEGFNQTEQFIEITLSEVPEATTSSQSTSLNTHLVNITKQTTVNPDNQASQEMKVPMVYLTTIPGISTDPPIDTKQAVTYDAFADNISSFSNTSYVLIQDKNNTKQSEDFSFVPEITKEPQLNVTHNDDKIISQANTITSEPLSHATVPVKLEETASNKIVLHSPPTFATASTIEASTATLLHTDYHPDEGSSMVTKVSLSPVTSTYTENYLNSQSLPNLTEIQSLGQMEPLPTQLIDSLSNVMNQVSEVRPSVLSLSNEAPPEISIMHINYDQRRNVTDSDKPAFASADTLMSHDTNEMNIGRVSTQTYVAATTEIPSQDVTTRLIDYSNAQRPVDTMNRESINDTSVNSRITVTTPATSIKIEITSNEITANNILATTPAGSNVESLSTKSESASSSFTWVQLEKTHGSSPGNQTKTLATLETTTAINVLTLDKQATDQTTELSEEISPVTSTAVDVATKTQSIITSSESSNKLNEYFDNVLANLNLNNPVSAIDQVLNIAPLPPSISAIEPIDLPSDTTNFVASDLASSLIAGFTTNTSEGSFIKEIGENQMVKNIDLKASTDATKFTESTESVTKAHEETVGFNANEYQEEKNIIQATTQKTMDLIENGTSELIMQTKESNDTLEPIKLLNKNESIINDSTKISLPTSLNKFTNISDELKDSVGQSTITTEIVTANSEQLLNINTTNNQKKTENREKVKTTEASAVRTDESLELPQLPVKIELINSANTGNITNSVNVLTESTPKIETLNKKHESLNASSAIKETVAVHSANDSNSEFYNSHNISNIMTNTVSNASNVMSDGNSVNSMFLQNHVNNTTNYKNKNNINKNNNNSLSSPSIQEHVNTERPIIQVVTPKLSENTSENKEELSHLINDANNLNSANNTLNQNNKNVTHTMSAVNTSISSIKYASTLQMNNTEGKPASLKHSENSSKSEVIRLPLSTPPSIRQTSKPTVGHKTSEKSDISKTETDANVEDKWTLISQQTSPIMTKPPKPLRKPVNPVQTQLSSNSENENVEIRSPEDEMGVTHHPDQQNQHTSTQPVLPLWDASQSASGLDVTTKYTSTDISNFARLCNELAFNFWVATNKGLSTARSLALSPFGMTSLLAMIFLGARGPTSDQMNEVLRLDDVATFNPHLVFQNITDTVSLARGQGIANAAFVRELFADKMKEDKSVGQKADGW